MKENETPIPKKEMNLSEWNSSIQKTKKWNSIAFTIAIVAFVLFYGVTWATNKVILGFTIQITLLIISGAIYWFGANQLYQGYKHLKDQTLIQDDLYCLKKSTFYYVTFWVTSIFILLPSALLVSPEVEYVILMDSDLAYGLYFLFICIFSSILAVIKIDRIYQDKWDLNPSFFYRSKRRTQIIIDYSKYLFLFILMVAFLYASNRETIAHFIIVGTILLIIDDLYHLIINRKYIIIRLTRLIMSIIALIIFYYVPSSKSFVFILDDFLQALRTISFVVTVGYITLFLVKIKHYSLSTKVKHVTFLLTFLFYFLTINFIYLTSINESPFYIEGSNQPIFHYDYSSINQSFTYSFMFIALDLLCRLINQRIQYSNKQADLLR